MTEEKRYTLSQWNPHTWLWPYFLLLILLKKDSAGCLYPDHQKQREVPTWAPISHPNFHRVPNFSSKDLLQGCSSFYSWPYIRQTLIILIRLKPVTLCPAVWLLQSYFFGTAGFQGFLWTHTFKLESLTGSSKTFPCLYSTSGTVSVATILQHQVIVIFIILWYFYLPFWLKLLL